MAAIRDASSSSGGVDVAAAVEEVGAVFDESSLGSAVVSSAASCCCWWWIPCIVSPPHSAYSESMVTGVSNSSVATESPEPMHWLNRLRRSDVVSDMEGNEELQAFTYPYPCGDLFRITKEDLRVGGEIARCPNCSLYIAVIYNMEDF